MSPTQRTLKYLSDDGWMAGVTEYWQGSFAERAVIDAAKRFDLPDADYRRGIKEALERLSRTGPGRRVDLYGFVDVVACGPGPTRFVQCTAYSGMSARVNKIVLEHGDKAMDVLRSRDHLEVWGWKKFKKAENRKFWRPVVRRATVASNGALCFEKLDV